MTDRQYDWYMDKLNSLESAKETILFTYEECQDISAIIKGMRQQAVEAIVAREETLERMDKYKERYVGLRNILSKKENQARNYGYVVEAAKLYLKAGLLKKRKAKSWLKMQTERLVNPEVRKEWI